jgi:hypothetical protein
MRRGSSDGVTMMAPLAASERVAIGRSVCCAATARATLAASVRLQVMKIDRTSGSCSACATRSAAIQSALPPPATMTISVGPA